MIKGQEYTLQFLEKLHQLDMYDEVFADYIYQFLARYPIDGKKEAAENILLTIANKIYRRPDGWTPLLD